jgi:hypothetical protein
MGRTNLKAGAAPPPEIPGRDDLRFWHQELAAALRDECEGVALVTRLREAVETGQRAEASAVAGLVASRGQALQNAGELTSKITNGELAKRALPIAEEKLATAQSETTRLRVAVTDAAKRELVSQASVAIAEYNAKAAELCALYDYLNGVKGALLGEAGHRALEVPNFRMVANAEVSIFRHGPTDGTGEVRKSTMESQANWTKALDRLLADPSADLSDLIA